MSDAELERLRTRLEGLRLICQTYTGSELGRTMFFRAELERTETELKRLTTK